LGVETSGDGGKTTSPHKQSGPRKNGPIENRTNGLLGKRRQYTA